MDTCYERCMGEPSMKLVWGKLNRYMQPEHNAGVWWGLVGKETRILTDKSVNVGWCQVINYKLISGWIHKEPGLYWVIGMKSSNVFKMQNKWTWISILFPNCLLDFALYAIDISKALQRQNQARYLPFLIIPPLAFPILFVNLTICSSQPSLRSWGHLHLIFIPWPMRQRIPMSPAMNGTLVHPLLSIFSSELLSI